MSNYPGTKSYVQTESILTRRPVSESTIQTISGSTNFILEKMYQEHSFKLNGTYKLANGKLGVDGLLIFQYNAEIFNIILANQTAGTSGTTQIDLKKADNPGGTFTSIFTTIPEITSVAANFSYIGIGETLAGATAPILTSSPSVLNVNAGDCLRCDVLNVMSGSPANAEIIVYYRPR